MFIALLHHISQYTSIGDCGQSVQLENRRSAHPLCLQRMLMGRRGGYVMAGDVCVICSAPSGSSVINLANQTNPDINYSNLIAKPVQLERHFQTHTIFYTSEVLFTLPQYTWNPCYYYLYMFSSSDLCEPTPNWIFVMRKSGRERRAWDQGSHCIIDSAYSFFLRVYNL